MMEVILEDSSRRATRPLAPEEVDALLKRGYWGVLALSVDDQPYGVPIIYGYDEDHTIYVANGPGTKLSIMERNPNVTLTVVEVEEFGQRWRSVIVRGRVEFVEELQTKLHAFNTLRKQMPSGASPRLRDAAKLASASVVRIVPIETTGRATG